MTVNLTKSEAGFLFWRKHARLAGLFVVLARAF
jgi:hypothetical protein